MKLPDKPPFFAPGKLPADFWLPLPSARRWEHELAAIARQKRWIHLYASPQFGKSTCNYHVWLTSNGVKRDDGTTLVPVALGVAGSVTTLLASIAESIGGLHLLHQPQRVNALGRAMGRVGTSLLIINNAHRLEWRQIELLLSLEEAALTHGSRFGVALSGVRSELQILGTPLHDDLANQLRFRLRDSREVEANSSEEIQTALELICKRDAPELIRAKLPESWQTVRDELSTAEFGGSKKIIALHLVELVRCCRALRKKGQLTTGEELVMAGIASYRLARIRATAALRRRRAKAA